MRIALVDSGLGLLNTAAALSRQRPDAELILSTDPDFMPWGPKPRKAIAERVSLVARAALRFDPDALVLACNTGSVVALEQVRALLEPDLPVIGTIPAVEAAAADGGPVAVWATPITADSAHATMRRLQPSVADVGVTFVPCPGLAEAIDHGDETGCGRMVEDALSRTPARVRGVVLGCTHYGLVRDRIRAELGPDVRLYDAVPAVAAEAVRRAEQAGRVPKPPIAPLTVLASGRPAALPAVAAKYEAGRSLARLAGVSRLDRGERAYGLSLV